MCGAKGIHLSGGQKQRIGKFILSRVTAYELPDDDHFDSSYCTSSTTKSKNYVTR